ncbi:DUF3857 and transglutaminase domain-containing protein [Catalinimonas niigatensis]|uniref:DUF3857 and transglutaminase domain-containing protein n=1 Tax=Catalinimonas niigatensis TaxID=1397264 RepID=UPI002665257F|nr:DUF3857 and transglutaminase domain-containing protein [Catalinimonas niigatensis]WPP50436.1 DUF3857 and transglutaminase domain-containing protein [Catalinimonas niigatensis]
MIKPYSLILFIFSLLSLPSLAQDAEIKFGKVSQEELSMHVYPLDSSASAVVLSDIGNTRFKYSEGSGIQLEFTRHTRIKILSTSGYEWANVRVPLYNDGKDKERISSLKGYTYNLVNGNVEKEKLKSSSEFSEKYSDHYDIAKFTMPAVKEGSVLEYEYTITSDFMYNLQDWEFQKSIPVMWSEYNVSIPEYFNYKQFMRGYHSLAIHDTGKKPGKFTYSTKTRSGGRGLRDANLHTNFKNESLDFTEYTERWVATDVPALVEEPHITTMDDYVMKITFELASIMFPGETMKVYSTTWENIDKELLDAEYFGNIIQKKGVVKKEVDALAVGETDPMKKLAILYTYMRDQVRWNGDKRLFASQTSQKTLENKSGNSADINLTLIAMLNYAGIETYPVALSTRDHGILIPSYPMINQFNYVIAMVKIDGQTLLLDATEQNCPFNLLPIRCLNGNGRVVSNEASEKWVKLEELQNANTNQLVVAYVSLNEAQQLEAKISSSSTDYLALKLRQKYSKGEEERSKPIKEQYQGWNITNYEATQWEDIYKPVEEKMQGTMNNEMMETGDIIYLNPILINRVHENPFKLEDRTYPVDYAHTNKQMYMMNFTIPQGYEVEELPESIALALPDNGGKFIYQTKQIGHMIQVVNKLEIHKSRFDAQEYPYLREFYNQIVAKQSEQLVLRKQKLSE